MNVLCAAGEVVEPRKRRVCRDRLGGKHLKACNTRSTCDGEQRQRCEQRGRQCILPEVYKAEGHARDGVLLAHDERAGSGVQADGLPSGRFEQEDTSFCRRVVMTR